MLSILLASSSIRSQSNLKEIRLTDVIEQGLRLNYREKNRLHARRILELEFQNSWDDLYLPKLQLSLTTTPHRLASLQSGQNEENPSSTTPNGVLEFGLKNYNLFNWGKDHLRFLNTKANYLKEKRNIVEKRRILRLEVIQQYFELVYRQKELQVRRKKVHHSSMVYKLNKDRALLKKIGKQEYYQTRGEYLQAQNQYHLADQQQKLTNEKMAALISDPHGSNYLLLNDLNYTELKLTIEEAMKLAGMKNSNILDARVNLSNAKRQQKIVAKENLLLPKLELQLGAFSHVFGESNVSRRKAIGVVASMRASWNLIGKDNVFNQRKNKEQILINAQAFDKLEEAQHLTRISVQEHFYKIKHLENQIKILNARTTSLNKLFDATFENYNKRKTLFINFKNALDDMVEANILLHQYHYLHAREKIDLAQTIGVPDFPGENFEDLAKEMTP